jgi:hypothetical protein
MFAMPSFLALIVQPSASANISRAISIGARSCCPASRVLTNHEFSAKRQASRKSGTPYRRQTAATARALASDTGWPPPELLVMVSSTSGTRARPSSPRARSSASTSRLPLNGWRAGVARLGDRQVAPLGAACSTCARVVSKSVLLSTTSPGFATEAKRMCSAARPWCVGITCGKPVMSCTAASKR